MSIPQRGRRIDVWLEARPDASYPADSVMERTAVTEPVARRPAQALTVEFQHAHFGHPTTYGLLGASFVPDNSGILRVQVALAPRDGWPGDREGIDVPYASRWRGIRWPMLADGIFAAVLAPEDVAALGSGVLRFDHAIEDGSASSAMMFGWLALIIVRLMTHDGSFSPEQREDLFEAAISDAIPRVTGTS